MTLSLYQFVLVAGMLITGSINTLSKKAQNDCRVEGLPEGGYGTNTTREEHSFDHPWFQTVIMFIGGKLVSDRPRSLSISRSEEASSEDGAHQCSK